MILITGPGREAVLVSTSHGYETELSPFGSWPSMSEALGRLLGRTGQIEEGQPGVQGLPVSEHSTFYMTGEEPGFRLWVFFN